MNGNQRIEKLNADISDITQTLKGPLLVGLFVDANERGRG